MAKYLELDADAIVDVSSKLEESMNDNKAPCQKEVEPDGDQ